MVQHENDHSGEGNADERDTGALARIVRLISGEYLLTVNPVDGSEIEPCPPGRRPETPRKRPVADRPAPQRPGPGRDVVLRERDEERERLSRLLGRGRSIRLTGPHGSGRTVLLDAVARDVADLAPDGVIRLSGYRRTVTDVLQDLFAAVYDAPRHRPDRRRLREALSTVGAVVILDDLEFGGDALDELLTATPECAYLVAATPDVAPPSEKARIEEVFLPGLSRTGSLELLEQLLHRPLTDDESDWAGDLWFLSEGSPLTFVQAAALLRQRGGGTALAVPGTEDVTDQGLPAGTGIAANVAAGLSGCARDALRVAVALGGELPRDVHLPALLNQDHADEAPGELADAGLVTEAGGHYRLAHGVADQLGARHEDDPDARVEAVAQHYAWWVAHPSVAAERVVAEADALVATVTAAQRCGKALAAVHLARATAPVLAAASRWGVWERVLRSGQEAARAAGEVAEQGYFHHELGVLALCQGNPERARSELDASIALRAALADKHGTVAGRRALALVTDRLAAARATGRAAAPGVSPGTPNGPTIAGAGAALGTLGTSDVPSTPGTPVPGGPSPTGPGPGTAPAGPSGPDEPATAVPGPATTGPGAPDDVPTAPTPKALYDGPPAPPADDEDATAAALSRAAAMDDSIAALRAAAHEDHDDPRGGRRGLAVRSTRKNVLAAGAGAVLAAVLGTVVTLGAASDSTDDPSGGAVQPDQSSSLTDDYGDDDPQEAPTGNDDPSVDPEDSATPGPSGEASPSPTSSAEPSSAPGSSGGSTGTTGGSGDAGTTSGGSGSGGNGGTTGGTTGDPDGGATGGPGGATDGQTGGSSGDPDGGTTGGDDGGTTDGGATDGGATDGTDGGSSSPTASGTPTGATATGTPPTGTAAGGTGGPVV